MIVAAVEVESLARMEIGKRRIEVTPTREKWLMGVEAWLDTTVGMTPPEKLCRSKDFYPFAACAKSIVVVTEGMAIMKVEHANCAIDLARNEDKVAIHEAHLLHSSTAPNKAGTITASKGDLT